MNTRAHAEFGRARDSSPLRLAGARGRVGGDPGSRADSAPALLPSSKLKLGRLPC
jgi:hypothetical protein